MRGYYRWLAIGLSLLLTAICAAAYIEPDDDGAPIGVRAHAGPPLGQGGISSSFEVLPPPALHGVAAPAAPLCLPVHVAPPFPTRLAHGGEVFYTVSFPLGYTGGPVTLAGDAAGTRHTAVDDQMIMRVTHADGTASTYQDKEYAEALPPMDLSQYFRPGVNTVEITLRDVCGDVMSATDLWLTDKKPAPARLPLALLDGVVPESAWPAALATVTVTGPRPGRKAMLAGDRQGRAGTWATGQMTIRVTHADGSAKEASYDYTAPEGPPRLRPPVDVTFLFAPGPNTVELGINTNGAVASSPIWLAIVRE